ncbi:MAG: alpha-amylase family glycosyl hydrolase, partial [Microcystaceae cyanobacterium]
AYDGSKPANYVSWGANRALPMFNHAHPQVREYIMQVGEYWIKKGIDGWRLDVPDEITIPGFWQEFRSRIKAINPEAYIVGEVWEDSRQWLDGTHFDGVMNYLFTALTIAFCAGDRVILEEVESRSYYPYPALSALAYGNKIQHLLDLYAWEIQLTQLNLLDSHDTARLISIAGGDRASVELATLLLLTFPGAPCIYYGDEVGLEGKLDPDCRRGFPKQEEWDLEVFNYHKQLIALRHQYQALRVGDYRVLFANETVYVFARILDKEEIIIAVNIDINPAQVQFEVPYLQSCPERILYGNGQVVWKNQGETNQVELSLPSRSGCVVGTKN